MVLPEIGRWHRAVTCGATVWVTVGRGDGEGAGQERPSRAPLRSVPGSQYQNPPPAAAASSRNLPRPPDDFGAGAGAAATAAALASPPTARASRMITSSTPPATMKAMALSAVAAFSSDEARVMTRLLA